MDLERRADVAVEPDPWEQSNDDLTKAARAVAHIANNSGKSVVVSTKPHRGLIVVQTFDGELLNRNILNIMHNKATEAGYKLIYTSHKTPTTLPPIPE